MTTRSIEVDHPVDDVSAILISTMADLAAHAAQAELVPIVHRGELTAVLTSFAVLELAAPEIAQFQKAPINPIELPVLSIETHTDAQAILAPELTRLAKQGALALPVVIGQGGTPKGALLSIALCVEIDREISRLQAAHLAAERIGLIDPETFAERQFNAICAEFDVDPDDIRARQEAQPSETKPSFSDSPLWASE